MALKKCTSLTHFQNSARKEYEIICKKRILLLEHQSSHPCAPYIEHIHFLLLEHFIGTSSHPCAPYIEHIHFLLLEHHPIHVLLTLSIYTFFYWNIIPSMCSLHVLLTLSIYTIGTSSHPCAPYIDIHFLLLEHHPIHVLLTLSIYTFFYWNIIPSMCSLH